MSTSEVAIAWERTCCCQRSAASIWGGGRVRGHLTRAEGKERDMGIDLNGDGVEDGVIDLLILTTLGERDEDYEDEEEEEEFFEEEHGSARFGDVLWGIVTVIVLGTMLGLLSGCFFG